MSFFTAGPPSLRPIRGSLGIIHDARQAVKNIYFTRIGISPGRPGENIPYCILRGYLHYGRRNPKQYASGIDFAALGERAAAREAASGSFPPGREARRHAGARLRALMQAGGGEGAAWEWLADNRCLIEREARAAARGLASAGRLRAGSGARPGLRRGAGAGARGARGRGLRPRRGRSSSGFQRRRPAQRLRELDVLPRRAARGAGLSCSRRSFPEARRTRRPSRRRSPRCARLATGGLRPPWRRAATSARWSLGATPPGPTRAWTRARARSTAGRLARLARREGMEELDCARRVLDLAGSPRRGRRSAATWAGGCCASRWAGPYGRRRAEPPVRSPLLAAAAASLGALDAVRRRGCRAGLPPGAGAGSETRPGRGAAARPPAAGAARAWSWRTASRTRGARSAPSPPCSPRPRTARRWRAGWRSSAAPARGCGGNLAFALLADLPEAKSESLPTDAAVLGAAREAVDALNAKYGGGFLPLHAPAAARTGATASGRRTSASAAR